MNAKIRNYKKSLLVILGVVVLIGLGWFIFSGNYPIAFVDFKIISANNYNKNYLVSLDYYEKVLKTYAKDSQVLKADEARQEIKRAVLDNLIENALIEKELKKEVGRNELNQLIDKKIKEISESQIFQKAAETLYGFSFEEFEEKVLIPQAEKEIFEGRAVLKNEKPDEKLKEIKLKANIRIFIPGFEWNGEEVVIK